MPISATCRTSSPGIEDEIQLSRRYYNGAVRNLNTMIEVLPHQLRRQFLQVHEGRVLRDRRCGAARNTEGRFQDALIMIRAAPFLLWSSAPRRSPALQREEVIRNFVSDVTVNARWLARRARDHHGQCRGQRDQARHPPRFPDHLYRPAMACGCRSASRCSR